MHHRLSGCDDNEEVDIRLVGLRWLAKMKCALSHVCFLLSDGTHDKKASHITLCIILKSRCLSVDIV